MFLSDNFIYCIFCFIKINLTCVYSLSFSFYIRTYMNVKDSKVLRYTATTDYCYYCYYYSFYYCYYYCFYYCFYYCCYYYYYYYYLISRIFMCNIIWTKERKFKNKIQKFKNSNIQIFKNSNIQARIVHNISYHSPNIPFWTFYTFLPIESHPILYLPISPRQFAS